MALVSKNDILFAIICCVITLIHGDDITASRNFYIDQRNKHPNPTVLIGKDINLADLTQVLLGGGFFNDNIFICIEEFFSKRKQSSETDAIINLLKANEETASVVLWESKELTPKQAGYFKKAISRQFSIPRVIFTFLDSLRPTNTKMLLTLYHQMLLSEDAEFIFSMIIRQMRLLLAVTDQTQTPIAEVVRMQPWMKTKLIRQAKAFSIDHLKKKYQELFEIDKAHKTGNLPYSLTQAIDFWLVGI